MHQRRGPSRAVFVLTFPISTYSPRATPMFFKPNAKKLLEQLNAAPTGLEEMRRIRAELHSIGEKKPAALVELLDEHNSEVIGRAIRKSGNKGLDLLFEIIRQTEHPLRSAAIKALWEF